MSALASVEHEDEGYMGGNFGVSLADAIGAWMRVVGCSCRCTGLWEFPMCQWHIGFAAYVNHSVCWHITT
jgi:hypothetical protein